MRGRQILLPTQCWCAIAVPFRLLGRLLNPPEPGTMQLAARLRLAGAAAASKALPTPQRISAAIPAASSAGASGAWASGRRRSARRLHGAAAASQEQLARQPRDNEDAVPTTIADPGQNPLFQPYMVSGSGVGEEGWAAQLQAALLLLRHQRLFDVSCPSLAWHALPSGAIRGKPHVQDRVPSSRDPLPLADGPFRASAPNRHGAPHPLPVRLTAQFRALHKLVGKGVPAVQRRSFHAALGRHQLMHTMLCNAGPSTASRGPMRLSTTRSEPQVCVRLFVDACYAYARMLAC